MTKFDNLISGHIGFNANPYSNTFEEGYFAVKHMNRPLYITAHKSLKHIFLLWNGESFSQDFLEKWATLDPDTARYSINNKKLDLNTGI